MKIKKLRLLSLVIMFFIMVGIIPLENSYGLSESEPNNTITQVTKLKFGQEYTGTIKDYNDIDYYKITVPNDGKRWVFYEIGDELKKVEELKDFDSQIEAFKHLASKYELEYIPGETIEVKNSFEQ